MIKITLAIEMAENGYVLTRKDDSTGITATYVFQTYAELHTAISNMVGLFER